MTIKGSLKKLPVGINLTSLTADTWVNCAGFKNPIICLCFAQQHDMTTIATIASGELQ